MRMATLIVLAACSAACEDRRSFDERFNDAQQQVENKARALDNRLEANAVGAPEKD